MTDGSTSNTAFDAYATLYARVRNKRYTLAVLPSPRRRTAGPVLAKFLGVLERLNQEVEAVYLDREFCDGKCLTLLQPHNYAYVTLIMKWGEAIQEKLDQGWSRTIDHDLPRNSTVQM